MVVLQSCNEIDKTKLNIGLYRDLATIEIVKIPKKTQQMSIHFTLPRKLSSDGMPVDIRS